MAVLGNQESIVLFYLQFTHKCIVSTLQDLYNLTLATATATTGKERHTHIVVGERMARISLGHHHRLALVVGIEYIVTMIVTLEGAKQRCSTVGKLVAAEDGFNEKPIEHKVVEYAHTERTSR